MEKLRYIFDVDGTICNDTHGLYENCQPYRDRIKQINKLYSEGHEIIFQTARGMGSTNGDQKAAIEKYYEFTKKQLDAWGCLYHKLYLGKPSGDIYIDDKCENADDYFDVNKY